MNKKSKKSIDKNVEHKAKKAVISLGQITKTSDLNQHSSISRISNKKVRLEETNNKPITKKESEMKNKITSQKISLKNVNDIHRINHIKYDDKKYGRYEKHFI